MDSHAALLLTEAPDTPATSVWRALLLLHEALAAALGAGRDPWEFALEIGQLRALGLTNTDLRRLLCRGYVAHAQEQTGSAAPARSFHPVPSLALPERTCFVLTALGGRVASGRPEEGPAGALTWAPHGAGGVALERPVWDSAVRELRWQGRLVKHFRVPAANQEAVLAALEQQGWPPRIDDPLPEVVELDPKVRLHDTIKALNRRHVSVVLRFLGDGTGRGIAWRLRGPR
jgi:hypothetical protein